MLFLFNNGALLSKISIVVAKDRDLVFPDFWQKGRVLYCVNFVNNDALGLTKSPNLPQPLELVNSDALNLAEDTVPALSSASQTLLRKLEAHFPQQPILCWGMSVPKRLRKVLYALRKFAEESPGAMTSGTETVGAQRVQTEGLNRRAPHSKFVRGVAGGQRPPRRFLCFLIKNLSCLSP
jgi:hypothetical protein